MASFFDFRKLGRHFGTRLFWYPFGCLFRSTQRGIKTNGHQNGKSFEFENLTFWYPFVWVPVWVPPMCLEEFHLFAGNWSVGNCIFLEENRLLIEEMAKINTTAGFLYRIGAETPPNFREIFWVSLRMIFSGVDTQTAVLVSIAKVWISAPDTQTSVILGFLGIHCCFGFFCLGTNIA